MPTVKDFGHKLKLLREERGLTQQDLAYRLKITIATLSRYENGHRSIPTKIINKVAKLFALEANYFFDYSLDDIDVPEIQSREYVLGSILTTLSYAPYELLQDVKKYVEILIFKDRLENELDKEKEE